MKELLLCSLLGLLTAACAPLPTAVKQKLIEAPDAALAECLVLDGTQARLLPAGAKLKVGQSFALKILLEGSGYVYVLRTPKVGDSERVFPRPGAADLRAPVGALQLPFKGGWMRFTSWAAGDVACVLLSSRPLTQTEQRCPGDKPERGKDIEPPPPPPPTRGAEKDISPAPPPPPETKRAPQEGEKERKWLWLVFVTDP